jgi:hypothetical protein
MNSDPPSAARSSRPRPRALAPISGPGGVSGATGWRWPPPLLLALLVALILLWPLFSRPGLRAASAAGHDARAQCRFRRPIPAARRALLAWDRCSRTRFVEPRLRRGAPFAPGRVGGNGGQPGHRRVVGRDCRLLRRTLGRGDDALRGRPLFHAVNHICHRAHHHPQRPGWRNGKAGRSGFPTRRCNGCNSPPCSADWARCPGCRWRASSAARCCRCAIALLWRPARVLGAGPLADIAPAHPAQRSWGGHGIFDNDGSFHHLCTNRF